MDSYRIVINEILEINSQLLSLFSAAKSIPGMSDYSFGDWEKTCGNLPKHLTENIVRVAVIGPIKSGKSTFLNSVFQGDYVKRGAGVVTSIVTRVRSGERLRASLFFKSWGEVNADMQQALVLFPSLNWRTENGKFDIRIDKERRELQRALADVSSDQLITHDTRNINNVLLSSYLKGYDTARAFLGRENTVKRYKDDLFAEHKAFAGDETLAVYLKDILLEISSGSVKSNIEIADCQGSDSSNPLHLAMIQDYLMLTHLIVYVVSSRTGLRQADIRFLSMIKKMGIIDNIFFVINCDFSEHESIRDLQRLVDRVQEELSMIKPEPQIYAFSALYNLFSSLSEIASKKDRLRFEQWKADTELADFSKLESNRFNTVFYEHLAQKRKSLLLENHIERLGVMSKGIADWIDLNRDVLANNADRKKMLLDRIRRHQQRLNQLKSAIKNSLSGAIPVIKKELHLDVNRFLDAQAGDMVTDIENFISNYSFSAGRYEESLQSAGFSQTLYHVFQEFKHAVDTFIAEVINPEIIRFIHSKEVQIGDYFQAVIDPFDTMVDDAYHEYMGLSDRNKSSDVNPSGNAAPEINAVIQESGLVRPPLIANMSYSTKIKTEAYMRLGYYRVSGRLKKIVKRSANAYGEEALKALNDGVQRMKRETKQSIIFHFKDYQENLKFSYLYKLVDATAASYAQALLDHFQAHFFDLSSTIEQISSSQHDKDQASKIFNEMDPVSRELNNRIHRIRNSIAQA
ncbi:MAG: dynamin family protein [Desulfobacterales bacterium]|jgi:GTPase SAR1 family protein